MATTNPVVPELLTISISTIDVGKEEERLMRVGCHYVPAHVKAAASLPPVRRRNGCYSGSSSPLFSASPLHSLVTISTSPFERENALFVSENCAGLSSSNLKGLIDGALEE